MGLLSSSAKNAMQRLLSAYSGGTVHFSPRVTYMSPDELAQVIWDPTSLTAAQMWRTQPHLRTVVSFMARNIAQLGVHSFIREGESDRRRDRESVVARTLRRPGNNVTTYDLVFALIVDMALYDKAYWWVAPSSETPSGWMIRRLPPAWVSTMMANPFEVKHYRVHLGQKFIDIKPENILYFPGFSPDSTSGCSPTVESLKDTLKEQIESARYRNQIWRRGGRVSSVLERPADAPRWSDSARNAFREDWHAKFTGDGSMAGGTPILEDGMKLNRIDFSAKEQQFVEAAKLALQTVAASFHVNPTMVGVLDNANYSNMREFRKMLYGDTLGPTIAQVEDRFNTFLVPMMGGDPATQYIEFNIAEKLQGNFEEQTQALQTSVGGPWMTVNEARAKVNLPAVEGGDVLFQPLNLQVGSPSGGTAPALEPLPEQEEEEGSKEYRVIKSLVQALRSKAMPEGTSADEPRRTKTVPVDPEQIEAYAEELRAFWDRQGRVVKSRLGAGEEWWDKDRWDRELTEALTGLHLVASTAAGRRALDDLGLDPDDYDTARTEAFLEEAAFRMSEGVNESSYKGILEALEDDDIEGAAQAVDSVLGEEASAPRQEELSVTLTTFVVGFGAVEAAKQQADQGVTKTWVVTSSNPRSSHAMMNGETVGIDEDFSNGMPWPGAGGDAEDTANCQCEVEITIP